MHLGYKTHMFMLCLLGFATCYKYNDYRDWLRVYVMSMRIGCMSMLRLQGLAAYLCYGYMEWLPTFLPDDQGRVTCDLLQPHLLGGLDQPREVDRQFGARAAPSVFLSQEHICTKYGQDMHLIFERKN